MVPAIVRFMEAISADKDINYAEAREHPKLGCADTATLGTGYCRVESYFLCVQILHFKGTYAQTDALGHDQVLEAVVDYNYFSFKDRDAAGSRRCLHRFCSTLVAVYYVYNTQASNLLGQKIKNVSPNKIYNILLFFSWSGIYVFWHFIHESNFKKWETIEPRLCYLSLLVIHDHHVNIVILIWGKVVMNYKKET